MTTPDAAPADGGAVPGASRSHTARTEANSRLTATAGTVLFFLLAVQGVTILRIHQLVGAHVVVGFALLGPLAVKVGSTGWRFARYYSGDADYTRAGPPRPLLRFLAPLVVATTLAVLATGIGLLFVTPGRGSVLVLLHKVTFIAWFGVMAVHVLAYVIPAWRWCLADLTGHGPPSVVATRRARQLVVGAGLAAGLSLGAVGLGWAHPWVSWFAGRP
ncbi:MAG TPA: hypothetical protein VGI06_03565 [Acidimicrobiales bacterium]